MGVDEVASNLRMGVGSCLPGRLAQMRNLFNNRQVQDVVG